MKKFLLVLLLVLSASFVSFSTTHAATPSPTRARPPLSPIIVARPAVGIGEKSNNGPSIVAGCDDMGESITFTGTDNTINTYAYNLGAPYPNGQGDLIAQGTLSYHTPASACHRGALDLSTHTWVAYTNTNGVLTLSEWESTPSITTPAVWFFNSPVIPRETVDNAPALVTCQDTLYVGWVGTDSSHHLNIMQFSDVGTGTSPVTTLTDYTRAGAGLSLACLNGQVYVAWLASSGTPHFYLGAYQPGNRQLQNSGPITSSDYAENAPAMSASDTSGLLEFLWKADTDTRLYSTNYNPSSHIWLGGVPTANVGTLYPPAADHAFTAYTGTDHTIYVDQGFFFS